jgi:hypothetical protein
MLESGEYGTLAELSAAEQISRSYICRVMRLTLLAPDIIERVIDGDRPPDTPSSWRVFLSSVRSSARNSCCSLTDSWPLNIVATRSQGRACLGNFKPSDSRQSDQENSLLTAAISGPDASFVADPTRMKHLSPTKVGSLCCATRKRTTERPL